MTRRLLVVDDALIIREKIKDAAREAGWEIAGEAANGAEAIDAYAALKPDLVTLDMVMPQFDGMHALRGIRAADPDARVVVVSALEQKAVLKEAFRNGAADFVLKPFGKSDLLATLQRACPDAAAVAQ